MGDWEEVGSWCWQMFNCRGVDDNDDDDDNQRGNIPIVALPPNLILSNLKKGTERVVTPGTTSRMTITSSGLLGVVILRECEGVCEGVDEGECMSTAL